MGAPVDFRDYFTASIGTHLAGVAGGVIWAAGMAFNLIASGRAGFAISYGLGQGPTPEVLDTGIKDFGATFPRRIHAFLESAGR